MWAYGKVAILVFLDFSRFSTEKKERKKGRFFKPAAFVAGYRGTRLTSACPVTSALTIFFNMIGPGSRSAQNVLPVYTNRLLADDLRSW
jgi:hypothetical protein